MRGTAYASSVEDRAPLAGRRGSAPAASMAASEIAALAALLGVATWLRVRGLGSLGLVVDEGTQALAVEGWLSSGLPIMPSGVPYTRAIPFGWLQALTSRVFALDEFALRLPAALFGVASVAVTFGLGRTLFSRQVGWTAAAFIALSAWEIELSRYARFYTAFQASYCLALYCFFRAAVPGARLWWRHAFAAACLLAISFHELSVVLVTCFLIPIFDRAATMRTRVVVAAAAVPFMAVWSFYRWAGEALLTRLAPPVGLEPLVVPEPGSAAARIPLDLPLLRLADLSALRDVVQGGATPFLVLVGLAAVAALLISRAVPAEGWRRVALPMLAIVFGLTHQFTLAALALFLHLAWYATSLSQLWARRLWPVHGTLVAALAYWTVALNTHQAGDWKAVVLLLFGFPNLLQHFVYWFALGWPVFLIAITVAGIALFAGFLRDGNRPALFLLAGIAMPLVVASAFHSFHEVRYVFHLYPLLAILFAWGAVKAATPLAGRAERSGVAGSVAFAAVLACGFLASGDVGALTWNAVTRTYDTPSDPMRSVISWSAYAGFHQDHEGPSRLVRDRAAPGDRVAAIGPPHMLAIYRFYVGRLDVALSRPEDASYMRHRAGRVIDWVTGAEIVYDPKQLSADSEGAIVWLLGDDVLLRDDVSYYTADVRLVTRSLVGTENFRGRDGVSFAARLP